MNDPSLELCLFLISSRPELMVKKLRYYARFIVVCLLLKKMKLVRDLVRELAKHIDEYTATYEPEDQVRHAEAVVPQFFLRFKCVYYFICPYTRNNCTKERIFHLDFDIKLKFMLTLESLCLPCSRRRCYK